MRADHPDHYAVLGLPTTASPEQITDAYRALTRALHPDTATDTASGDIAARFTAVTTAYQVLHDPVRRAAYDATDDRMRHTPAPPATLAPRACSTPHVAGLVAPAGPRPAIVILPTAPASLLRAGPVRISPPPRPGS